MCLWRVVEEQLRGAQDEVVTVYCRGERPGGVKRDMAVCAGGQVQGITDFGKSDEAGEFVITVGATATNFQRQIDLGGSQLAQR